MSLLSQDLRMVLRTRRRGRLVSLLAILSLALGIGGNAAFFSWVDTFLFEPLPFPEADRLVLLGEGREGRSTLAMVSMFTGLSTWADFRERSRTLDDWGAVNFTLLSRNRPEGSAPLFAGVIAPGTFRVLGVAPERGRVFTPAEEVQGGPRVAVLSWKYWMETGGPDSDPLGMMLTLDGEPYEVVGVMPEDFEFLVGNVDLWIPVRTDLYGQPRSRRGFIPVARMAPGASMDDVRVEMRDLHAELRREYPEALRGWEMRAYHLRTETPDPNSRLHIATIQGVVFFVLLIACANVAILLLARGEERRHEIALRMALGAGRVRIVGQILRESLVTAALGGAVGLALGAVAIRAFTRYMSPGILPRMFQPTLDSTVVVFTVTLTVLCGLVFGLAPAIQAFRRDHSRALKSGPGSSGGGRRARRLSGVLVAGEIAICLVALGGGSILLRSFQSVRARDPGFSAERLLAVEFVVPGWKHRTSEDRVRLMEEIRGLAERLPGVASAAIVNPPPQSLMVPSDTFRVDGGVVDEGSPARRAIALRASPQYLDAMQVHLLQGRFFQDADDARAPLVAVVDRSLAERWFPDRSPIGVRIHFLEKARTIIGVSENVQQTLVPQAATAGETVYVPLAQAPTPHAYLMVRTDDDPLALAGAVRRTFVEVDPDVAIHAVETMGQYARRYTAPLDVINPMLGAFGVFALLLAVLGTYGVVAYSVGQRAHEIAVRRAVGARRQDVVRMVAADGLKMSVVGLAAGALVLVPLTALAGRALEGFALASAEPNVVVGAGAVLFAVTIAASTVPARGAARVAPVSVLKTE